MWWVVTVVAAVVLVATYVTWTAARVDRLHARAAASLATLDAHLVRRSAAAVALGEAAQIPDLVYAARIAHQSRMVTIPSGTHLPVALARHVHNDVVRDALAMRRRIWVRVFRLAKKHPRPTYFDVDDPTITLPAASDGAKTGDATGEARAAG